ncbi:MBL fold metallo-hydrolase [Roseibacillus ishigakijimensis]|uniref:MBL fold metallo-hydrolase n=1 Tax=Roseibacillus ishigakijimensis TaxID=454146 RepID=A0A934VM94_9BACT|nr:MBL fold metallo-hydrolase [Roseibacillus ishigakijimensis]MBK1835519.1 MBL fold metallo-hydrolase [Roseibacillus ishigakijimensis]
MNFERFTGGFAATNGYLLQKDGTHVLVDAPAGSFDWLQKLGITPDALLLTHQHFDHVEDASLFDCPRYAFAPFSRDLILDQRARDWGLPVTVEEFAVSELLEGRSQLTVGPFTFELRHVPGHSPDSLVFSLPVEELALVGDTIFQGSYGRTDLPGGDEALLFSGIREKLLTLPEATTFYPGHGEPTTPGAERAFF